MQTLHQQAAHNKPHQESAAEYRHLLRLMQHLHSALGLRRTCAGRPCSIAGAALSSPGRAGPGPGAAAQARCGPARRAPGPPPPASPGSAAAGRRGCPARADAPAPPSRPKRRPALHVNNAPHCVRARRWCARLRVAQVCRSRRIAGRAGSWATQGEASARPATCTSTARTGRQAPDRLPRARSGNLWTRGARRAPRRRPARRPSPRAAPRSAARPPRSAPRAAPPASPQVARSRLWVIQKRYQRAFEVAVSSSEAAHLLLGIGRQRCGWGALAAEQREPPPPARARLIAVQRRQGRHLRRARGARVSCLALPQSVSPWWVQAAPRPRALSHPVQHRRAVSAPAAPPDWTASVDDTSKSGSKAASVCSLCNAGSVVIVFTDFTDKAVTARWVHRYRAVPFRHQSL